MNTMRSTMDDDDLPGQPKVLLVDDDEVNLLLTSIALRERGFDITEATSGEQAMRILTEWLPDVVVLDRNTRQVIDRGEGQIFATSNDRVNVYDSFEPAAEAGTYTARMNFITAGDWKVSIRFRRDSTAPLERVEDWVQTVRGARPISERPIQ